MAGITAAANGTLDVNSIVSQLVSAERSGIDKRLSTQQSKLQTRVSAFGSLKSAISNLQTSLAKLKDAAKVQPLAATSGDAKLVTATTNTSGTQAGEGSYAIRTLQLAQFQKLASNGFTGGATTVVGNGTLNLSVNGQSVDVNITAGSNDTLVGIRDAINNVAGNPGVRASILDTAEGSRLVLTSTVEGSDGAIKVAASGGDGGLAQFAIDGSANADTTGMVVKARAQNALFNIDGFDFTSKSNTVTSAIPGLTLNLLPGSLGQTTTVTVSKDSAATKQLLQDFVAAFNALNTKSNQLTTFNATTKVAGDLQGDATAVRLANTVRQQLNTIVSGADTSFDTLAELGITSDAKTGALSLDSAKVDAAIAAAPNTLSRFFAGSSGFATLVTNALNEYSGTGGLIESRTSGLQTSLKNITSQQDDVNKRMEALSRRLSTQFNNLNGLLSSMNNTSAFLSRQLASL